MSNTFKGISLAALTGLCWATTSPSSKLLGMEGIEISTAVFFRMLIVASILLIWLIKHDRKCLSLTPHELKNVFFFSFFGPTGVYLGFMLSVVYLNVATALVMHYTFPVVTTLCSAFFTGERPTRFQIVAAFTVTVGVACSVLTPQWHLNTAIDIRGIFWAAVAVTGIAGQTLWGRASNTKGGVSSNALFFYTHLFGLFWIALYITLKGTWSNFLLLSPYTFLVILIPALAACLTGYGLYYKALEYIPAPVASLTASVEIIIAVISTSLVTSTMPTAPEITGCLFIFTAIGLVSLSAQNK